MSSERQRIMAWNVDDVASHVRFLGCADQAKIFIDQVRISMVSLFYGIFLLPQSRTRIRLIPLVTIGHIRQEWTEVLLSRCLLIRDQSKTIKIKETIQTNYLDGQRGKTTTRDEQKSA